MSRRPLGISGEGQKNNDYANNVPYQPEVFFSLPSSFSLVSVSWLSLAVKRVLY